MKNLKLMSLFVGLLLVSSLTYAEKSVTRDKPLVDVDIGGSSGNYNGRAYTELNLGVNLNFTEWLTWRNSFLRSKTTVPWEGLMGQFGTESSPKKFRENFKKALQQVLVVYPAARVDVSPSGLVIREPPNPSGEILVVSPLLLVQRWPPNPSGVHLVCALAATTVIAKMDAKTTCFIFMRVPPC